METHIEMIRTRTIRMLSRWLIGLVALPLPFASARADALSEWHAIGVETILGSGRQPAHVANDMAVFGAAVFEALNFIVGRHEPHFLVKPSRSLGASGEIEAVGAAHYVLTQLYPDRKDALDAALERYLAGLANPDAASRARVWGRHLGGTVYTLWSAEGSVAERPLPRPAATAQPAAAEWHAELRRLVTTEAIEPIERARIYALVSSAAHRGYASAGNAKSRPGVLPRCLSCDVDIAVRAVLARELRRVGRIGSGSEIATARVEPLDRRHSDTNDAPDIPR